MNSYDEEVKKLQAEAMAKLQKAIAQPEPKPDPFRAERRMLISELITARFRKKLTQTELAAKAGIKQSNVSRIESGKSNPNLHTLLAITKALDVNLVLEYK